MAPIKIWCASLSRYARVSNSKMDWYE